MPTHAPTLVALVLALCASIPLSAGESAAKPAAQVAGVASLAMEIPEAALAAAKARRVLVVGGGRDTPLTSGLRLLGASDARFAMPLVSAWSGPRTGPALLARQAESGVRADHAVEALRSSLARQTQAPDVAVLDLSSQALPAGRRVSQPIRIYTANMEVNLTVASLAGSMTENIVSPPIIQSGGTTVVLPPANYPIELPNLEVQHLSTQSAVPAGWAPEGNWRMSPRDPRQALADVTGGLNRLAGAQAVYATLPLERSANAQRNWYNQALRTWCAASGRPLLDVAEILSTAPDGTVASDAEGPRLAEAWSDRAGSEEAARRVARAWWGLHARLATQR